MRSSERARSGRARRVLGLGAVALLATIHRTPGGVAG